MLVRCLITTAILIAFSASAQAQARRDTMSLAPAPAANNSDEEDGDGQSRPASNAKWRPSNAVARNPGAAASGAAPGAVPSAPSTPRQRVARVTPGTNTLPSDAGQEWRDYDISPYTTRVTSTARPEQAILDWILRETGYETWHTTPTAVLSIDNRKLSVYHTPEMHQIVGDMVDRFVNTEAESQVFGMRVITVGSPDWRAKDHRMLHPVAVQSQGVQAWLLAKEDAALLVSHLSGRSDFQEHSTPHLLVPNGQSKVISSTRPRNYVRDVLPNANPWPGFEAQMGQFDEGFKLEFNPLLSIDGKVVDAVIRCDIDQVEKMIGVNIPVPTTVAPRQQQKIEVPQPISTRLHERFRWPTDQVLLISLGVGPSPVPPPSNPLNLRNVPLLSNPSRADLLIFVQSNGKLGAQQTALPAGQPAANAYRNRY